MSHRLPLKRWMSKVENLAGGRTPVVYCEKRDLVKLRDALPDQWLVHPFDTVIEHLAWREGGYIPVLYREPGDHFGRIQNAHVRPAPTDKNITITMLGEKIQVPQAVEESLGYLFLAQVSGELRVEVCSDGIAVFVPVLRGGVLDEVLLAVPIPSDPRARDILLSVLGPAACECWDRRKRTKRKSLGSVVSSFRKTLTPPLLFEHVLNLGSTCTKARRGLPL